MNLIPVSVIIPVYNDSERLIKCLHALSDQTYRRDLFEVIVVDNRSEQEVKAVVTQFDFVQYMYEPTPGSYAARNHGISMAKGRILVFTDSDCIPASNWIEKGVEILLKNPDFGLIAGRINFYFRDMSCPTIAELYDSKAFLNQQKYIEDEQYGATANLFTFKSVFDKVGLFNSQLKSGGDREWGKRVYAAGYRQVYADEVCISHPARYSVKALKAKVLRVIEGQYFTKPAVKKPLPLAIKEFLLDAKPYLRYALKTLSDDQLPGFGYKLGFIYIHLVLRYARALKRLKLNLQIAP